MTIEICPSMLSANPIKLGAELTALETAGANAIHWDVMDGSFVDAITFGHHVIAAHRSLTTLRFDVHLMVQNPEKHIASFANAGADTIFIHPEACPHLHRALYTIKSLGKQAGVALNPATSIDCLKYADADTVLVMSVNPGKAGQSFISSQAEKIHEIRKAFPIIKICVDGGISDETIQPCLQAGANSVVAGAYIFKHNDYSTAINKLKNIT